MLPQPNIIRTGTGPFAWAGTTTASLMSTLMEGAAELSMWPITRRAITGRPPTVVLMVSVTSHVTFGTLAGMRPTTSRSKSSAISGRRCFHQLSAVVTLAPFFKVRTSGQSGKGLALA